MRLFVLIVVLFALSSGITAAEEMASTDAAAEEVSETVADILPESAVQIGEGEENGVLAVAYIFSPSEQEPSPISETSLAPVLFIRFLSVESNIGIEKGVAAYKLEDNNGEKTEARRLEYSEGYFIATLDTVSPGAYQLHIGSKLEDEKKRQFVYPLNIR
ncbi:MAG: hypothetical protein C0615_03390 [Desulfuromonas sp.]|nr:MAG: hypothetical protein C0615_03390 [Desulfuromonas sp.]